MAIASTSRVKRAILLTITICSLSFPAYAKYGGGTGEPNDPYLIYTAEQMNAIGLNRSDWAKHFKLMADIDLSVYAGGRRPDFNIIGSWSSPFRGVFDGNGHTISNFNYTSTGAEDIGLFAHIGSWFETGSSSNGEIKNLGLIDPNIDVGMGNHVGSLVGQLKNGTITGCYSEGGTVSGNWRVGSLVGYNHHGNITTSYSTGTVSGGDYVGGLVGYNYGDFEDYGRITSSYSTCSVSGNDYVGGLVGENCGSITTSHSTGRVEGDGSVGGLVGKNNSDVGAPGRITSSYSTGTVHGNGYVGGLVGDNIWGSSIATSYSTGVVTADGFFVGGLVGNNFGGITTSYSTGAVTGDTAVGGLVGWHEVMGSVDGCYSTGAVGGNWMVGGLVGEKYGSVTNSFWDIETSRQQTSGGGTGKTTAEMQMGSTFLDAGWDFVDETANGLEDIWWILEDQSYPRLWWQYGRAFSPHPYNGAVSVIQPLLLSWLPGGLDLYHDIYLGEDKEAIANATTESTEVYWGRQTAEMTTYDPGPLKLDKIYYWRIDEVNETDPNSMWKGYIWTFTTADYLLVDDFESYNDDGDPDEAIWQVWIDGFNIPENGAIVNYLDLFGWGWRGPRRIHGGAKSMDIFYDHSRTAYYSEATAKTAHLVIGKDWTREGVGVLSLWFHGDPNNAPEPMYVGLANVNRPTAVVYHNNPDAVLTNEWTEWRINLQEFAAQGVNLTTVDSISTGFGDKNNPQPGGTGLVFFDDIRLYRPQSVTSYDSEVNDP